MNTGLNILVTNDDGYQAKGLKALVETLRPYGHLTVIAPKYHQSGMSMAVTMGLRPIAVKHISSSDDEDWYYLDGTPSSCVKYAIDEIFTDRLPDVVVSGVNHGSNASSAALYSGTLGAAQEGALAYVPAIGISVDDPSKDADFSAIKELFPGIFEKLMSNLCDRTGIYYNVNFPKAKASEIKGIKVGHQGIVHWVKEFRPYDREIFSRLGTTPHDMGIIAFPEVEPGEKVYMMVGDLEDDPRNTPGADHHIVRDGYISICPLNIDSTDRQELERLNEILHNSR